MAKNDDGVLANQKPNEAVWERDTVFAFCDLCLEEIELGNRQGIHFNKQGWNNLVSNFTNSTGRFYDRQQLKYKWYILRKEWKLWKKLLKDDTGVGWDPIRNTVNASDQWWRNKIKVFPEASKFRIQGIEPELEVKLDRMFMDIVALGNDAWSPSSNVSAAQYLEESNDNADLGVDDTENQNKGKKKGKYGGGWKSGEIRLSNQIDRLCDEIEAFRKAKLAQSCSVVEAINQLDNLEEVPKRSSLYYSALKLFKNKVNREIFVALPIESKLWWLKKEGEQSKQISS